MTRRAAALLWACLLLAGCSREPRLSVVRDGDQFVVTVSPAASIGGPVQFVAGGTSVWGLPIFVYRAPRRTVLSVTQPVGTVTLEPHRGDLAQLILRLDGVYTVDGTVKEGTLRATVRLRADEEHTERLDPQVAIRHVTRTRPDRVLAFHVVRLEPAAVPRLKVRMAGPKLLERHKLSEFAAGAEVAINGGYFDVDSGNVLGALKTDGEWIRPPLLHRTALLLPRHGPTSIAAVDWAGTARDGNRTWPLDGLNTGATDAMSALATTARWPFTPHFDGFAAARPAGGSTVLYTRNPPQGRLEVTLASAPDVDGSILGAGPRLVEDGKVHLTAVEERFRDDITNTVTARCGVGLTADGAVLLVFVEGHRPQSRGLGLEEFAGLMAELGCRDALNLDGCTSSALLVRGALVGVPQAGHEVALPDALVVEPVR